MPYSTQRSPINLTAWTFKAVFVLFFGQLEALEQAVNTTMTLLPSLAWKHEAGEYSLHGSVIS